MKTHTFDTSTHAKIPCACQRKWNCHFFNHRKALRLPHKINVPFNEEKIRTTMNHDKRQKTTLQHIKKCENPARLPAKMKTFFLKHIFYNHRKTPRLPRRMHVLKFVAGHKLKGMKRGKARFTHTKCKFRKWHIFFFFLRRRNKEYIFIWLKKIQYPLNIPYIFPIYIYTYIDIHIFYMQIKKKYIYILYISHIYPIYIPYISHIYPLYSHDIPLNLPRFRHFLTPWHPRRWAPWPRRWPRSWGRSPRAGRISSTAWKVGAVSAAMG